VNYRRRSPQGHRPGRRILPPVAHAAVKRPGSIFAILYRRDDGIGPSNPPEHTRALQTTTDEGFAAGFDDYGTYEQMLTPEGGIAHPWSVNGKITRLVRQEFGGLGRDWGQRPQIAHQRFDPPAIQLFPRLKTMGPDELLLVLGHETGHYALYHIPKEFALDEAVALLFFFLGFFAVSWLVERAGPRAGVEGIGDLASLPVVLVVLALLVFLSAPIVNGISRYFEHQADQFGLEVAYGIVPDPNAAEIHSLQIMGEEDLADPDPNPFIKFWLYTHPPLDDRIRFAATYKPWAEGKPLELLRDIR